MGSRGEPAGARGFGGFRSARLRLRAVAGLAGFALGLLTTKATWADALAVRTTGIVHHQGVVKISVGVPDLFDEAAKQHLFSGFATRVLLRIALHRDDQELPVLLSYQRAEIVYDLWDEHFHVRLSRDDAEEAVLQTETAEQAVNLASSLWQFPLAEQKALPPGRYFLVLRADLNPISEETLNDLKRWLGTTAHGARPTSMDGLSRSFVSVFFNPRLDDSERQIRFSSQPWQERPR